MGRPSKRQRREEFIARMAREGVSLEVAWELMRHESSLHRIAERECSDESADRDRVPCPADVAKTGKRKAGPCLCDAPYAQSKGLEHETVPRITVRGARIQAKVEALCKANGLGVQFNGDPRGPAILLKVPSGYTDDWGQRGVCVP